jgi:tyrosyl-tRNA synthetase
MWYALRLAGDGRRLALQGGVRLDGTRVESVDCIITPGGQVLQVGKRRFVCLVPPS